MRVKILIRFKNEAQLGLNIPLRLRENFASAESYGLLGPLPTACVGVLTRARTGLQISLGKADKYYL